jgi:hypothetical protein
MRKIFAIAATLAVSSAATLTAAPSQAVTVAAPNALAATASQTQPGLEKAAVFCRWTRWGRRCTWGGPAFAWGGGPVWGWAAALGLAAAGEHRDPAHVPANWMPVRRQEHAPINESTSTSR